MDKPVVKKIAQSKDAIADEHLLNAISQNIREAHNSYTMMRSLFYDKIDDIPFTTNLFRGETVHVLHVALFSSMITSIGRLMDKNKRSASIPTAMKILRAYKPTDQHLEDLWRFNLSNWKYDFDANDVVLKEISEKDKNEITAEYLEQIPQIETEYQLLIAKYKPVELWRHKHIAHSDTKYAKGDEKLDPLPRKELVDFLDALKTIGETLCGKLFQVSIDANNDWAEKASTEILDYARQYQLGVAMANYIDRHSPNAEVDGAIFYRHFKAKWNSDEGADLRNRTLAKREEIKNRKLNETGLVTPDDIDNG